MHNQFTALYGRRWAKASRAYLKRHKLCVICGAPSQEVDHIEAHKGDRRKFWRRSNWQALCKPCHSRKTRSEQTGIAVRGQPGEMSSWFKRWGEYGQPY